MYSHHSNRELHKTIDAHVWNPCAALQHRYYAIYGKSIGKFRLMNHISKLKQLPPWPACPRLHRDRPVRGALGTGSPRKRAWSVRAETRRNGHRPAHGTVRNGRFAQVNRCTLEPLLVDNP